MKVYGSQTGDVIRSDVKRELDVVGRNDTWKVNWMIDGKKADKCKNTWKTSTNWT